MFIADYYGVTQQVKEFENDQNGKLTRFDVQKLRVAEIRISGMIIR